jgi:hypothetical protein
MEPHEHLGTVRAQCAGKRIVVQRMKADGQTLLSAQARPAAGPVMARERDPTRLVFGASGRPSSVNNAEFRCTRTMAERVRTDSRASQRPSRPGSSLSTATSSGARTATTATRPTSSLAYSNQQPPNHPKTPKPSAARYGGLAEKELQKVRLGGHFVFSELLAH